MKTILTFIFALLLAPSAFCQNRVVHYIKNHKAALVSDGIVLAAWEADVFSTIHCLHVSPGCTETNTLLGKRPSNEKVIGYGLISSGLEITALHVIDYLLKDDPYAVKVVRWFPTAAIAGLELFNVKSNVDAAEFLQNQQKARARLLR